MSNKLIIESIKNAPTKLLKQNDGSEYKFQSIPFGELGMFLNSDLIGEINNELIDTINSNFPEFDYIATTEPGSHPWAILLGLHFKKNVNIIRETSSEQDGEIKILKKRGYNPTYIHLNYFKKDDKIIIVEDVISSGGTLISILDELIKIGVKVVGVVTIYAKTDNYLEISKRYNIRIVPLVRLKDLR